MRQMVHTLPAVLGDMSSAGLLNIYGLVDTQVEQNSELKTTIQVGRDGRLSGLAGRSAGTSCFGSVCMCLCALVAAGRLQ